MHMSASTFVDDLEAAKQLADRRDRQGAHPGNGLPNRLKRPAVAIMTIEDGAEMQHLLDLSRRTESGVLRGKKLAFCLVPCGRVSQPVLHASSVGARSAPYYHRGV